MFSTVLVANRGEIAVRIVRACRDLGIHAVAVYDAADRGSLHVRLSDEAYPLPTPLGYSDPDALLTIARQCGADAIHPGYGFLAEDAPFARACEDAAIRFIGPSSACLALTRDKTSAIERVHAAGIATTRASSRSFGPEELEALSEEAGRIGYPLIVKSCVGGRGRGTRLVRRPEDLPRMVQVAQAAARALVGNQRVFLEAAILPSHYISVPLLGDRYGALIHLGERDGSIQRNNQKIIEETPAPALSPEQRARIWATALQIGRLFGLESAGVVEFVVDAEGRHFFTEIKARIQVEHTATEMLSRVDMVREQIRIAAGLPLSCRQEEVRLDGVAIQCRINAEDPWHDFLPSPGRLEAFRLPGGPQVRVDTYAYAGCDIPVRYDPLLAKLVVWGSDRAEAIGRLRRALLDLDVRGLQTNLPLLQRIAADPVFVDGSYTTEFSRRRLMLPPPATALSDLAAIVAIAAVTRGRYVRPTMPDRFGLGWHRDSRRLPR